MDNIQVIILERVDMKISKVRAREIDKWLVSKNGNESERKSVL